MAKGVSLHIGLNNVDPKHYSEWNGQLYGCEHDAKDFMELAIDQNFEVFDLLLTKNATRSNFIKAINEIADNISPGDFFLLTFSGHGNQKKDTGNDEKDGFDETWCLYDAQLLDDEIYQLLSLFDSGTRILIIADSCHSGSVAQLVSVEESVDDQREKNRFRFIPEDVAQAVYSQNRFFYEKIIQKLAVSKREVKASVILFSACQDDQRAIDGFSNGLFTETLLYVWDDGWFNENYNDFYANVLKEMPNAQTPRMSNIGIINTEFNNQSPFKI